MEYCIFIALGYLSGSVLYAYWVPYILLHADVTALSRDGNPGAANVFTHAGAPMGIFVLILELAKAAVPVYFAAARLNLSNPFFALVLASPVFGHAFPCWHGRQGGKAIAASFGVLLGLCPHWQPLLALAAYYLLFSLVLVISPHLYRSVITFLCFSITCFFLPTGRAVALGCVLLSMAVALKHLVSYRGEKCTLSLFRHPARAPRDLQCRRETCAEAHHLEGK